MILSDPQTAQFVNGVGFHGYAGAPEGMSIFHGELTCHTRRRSHCPIPFFNWPTKILPFERLL